MKQLYFLILGNIVTFSTIAKEVEISRIPLSVETHHPQHIKNSISKITIQENDTTLSDGAIGKENQEIWSEKFNNNGKYISEFSFNKISPKIGMTQSQIINYTYWDKPTSKKSTESKYGISESWYYRDRGSITFNNGIVEYIHRN